MGFEYLPSGNFWSPLLFKVPNFIFHSILYITYLHTSMHTYIHTYSDHRYARIPVMLRIEAWFILQAKSRPGRLATSGLDRMICCSSPRPAFQTDTSFCWLTLLTLVD